MNAVTIRIALVALGAIVLTTLFSTNSVHARIRDAGAKARGEFGTGFHNPRTKRTTTSYYAPPISRSAVPAQVRERSIPAPSVPSPTVVTTEAKTSPTSIVTENAPPAVAVPRYVVSGNRAVVNRNYSGSTKKRHSHIYRKQHPGTGFWN